MLMWQPTCPSLPEAISLESPPASDLYYMVLGLQAVGPHGGAAAERA